MTNDSVDAAGHESMPPLNRDQAAESLAQHKDRPDPQRTTGSEEQDTKPANRITIDCPQILAIGVCGAIRVEKSDDYEHGTHPAVAAGLAHAGAQVPAGEKRHTREREQHHHERYQCRVGEERPRPTPTQNRETGVRATADHDKRKSESPPHQQQYPMTTERYSDRDCSCGCRIGGETTGLHLDRAEILVPTQVDESRFWAIIHQLQFLT